MLRYGLTLPNGGECGDPRFVLELAERAEAAGWESFFLEDYVSYQGDPHEPTCDVWTTLGAEIRWPWAAGLDSTWPEQISTLLGEVSGGGVIGLAR